MMRHPIAIARRELVGFFYSPIAYVVLCVFALLAGLLFMSTVFQTGKPATLRPLFESIIWVLILIAPAISMRLISEELRSGTIETLMTSPVTDTAVIFGKWLGAMACFAVTISPTLIYAILLGIWGDPDYGPIITGYLGLMLVGGLYLAIGTFASVTTKNQIIAFLATVFIVLLLTVVTYFLPALLPPRWGEAVFFINVNEQYRDFAKGLVDLSHLIYFTSLTALFLVLAVKTLESRKWR